MSSVKSEFRHVGIALVMVAALGGVPCAQVAAQPPATDRSEPKERTASGTFVSFKDGTLTIQGKTGPLVYKQIGANYKSFENNENGPGSKLVGTADALGRLALGTVIRVNVEDREISFGLDHRVTGTFESFNEGKLNLLAAEAPPSFVKKPTGNVALTIDPNTPVLVSTAGGDYKFAGLAGTVLKTVKKGEVVTARSEYDPDIIEVIQIGEPNRRMERYVGQSRGTVRGTVVSFKDGVLRIRGKGVTSLAANEYERVIATRIADGVPIVESIDGGEYQPAGAEALKTFKEGTVVTIRKVEGVILEVQIGVPNKK